jgi:hypothetical protein
MSTPRTTPSADFHCHLGAEDLTLGPFPDLRLPSELALHVVHQGVVGEASGKRGAIMVIRCLDVSGDGPG